MRRDPARLVAWAGFLGRLFKRLLPSSQLGSVAVLFALTLPILIGFIGLGFDATRAHFIKMRLRAASDAAVLAAVSSRGTDAERIQIGKAMFAANYGTGIFAPSATLTLSMTDSGGAEATVRTDMAASFAAAIGFETLPISVAAAAQRPFLDIEVVLVVDISGSMMTDISAGKLRIEAVVDAGVALLDALRSSAPSTTRIKLGIVPYNVIVNIGTDQSSHVIGADHPLFSGQPWAGCVMERQPPHHLSNAYDPAATDGSGKWHAFLWPPEPDGASGKGRNCKNPSDGTNDGYNFLEENYPYGLDILHYNSPNYNCSAQPILPLTADLDAAETAIRNLYAAANTGTLVAPGVTWGLRVLTPDGPFAGAQPFSPVTHKIMVILTDGQQVNDWSVIDERCETEINSITPYRFDPGDFGLAGSVLSGTGPTDMFSPYGYILTSDPFGKAPKGFTEQADELLVEACDEAKAAATIDGGAFSLFTVTFTSDAGTSTSISEAMADCASTAEGYFHASNTQDLLDAFEDIASDIADSALSE